ncbi:hypothetical protein [Spiroplasma endosymbiont of Clivina fossor]|uniref:hypothetical protein n=1 Tax=Spiroplasma endosymbiont of Clivina fossor TaxID=3066282 RepID=UPI00313A862D
MLKEKHIIFKITISSMALGLALALSMLEIPIPLPNLPAANFEIGDTLILLVIPLIGSWFAMLIGAIKPWLHMIIPHHIAHGNIVVSASMGMMLNALVIGLYFLLNWIWKRLFHKENIYTKCTSILICCLATALFAAVNAQLWATDALGFHTHTHPMTIHPIIIINKCKNFSLHDPIKEISEEPLKTQMLIFYGIYGGFIFVKYLITFGVMLILEKPILRYAESAHYSYHQREKEKAEEKKHKKVNK